MKKKRYLVGLFVVVICLFLIFKFAITPSSLIIKKGVVENIFVTEHNDIVIELTNDSSFYINRGVESGIEINNFKTALIGHEIELYIQNKHLFGSNSTHISKIYKNDSCIYTE